MIYLYLHLINLKYSIFFLFSRFIMQITIVREENLKSHPCGYKIFPYVYGFTSLTTMINKGYTRLIFFPSNKDFTCYLSILSLSTLLEIWAQIISSRYGWTVPFSSYQMEGSDFLLFSSYFSLLSVLYNLCYIIHTFFCKLLLKIISKLLHGGISQKILLIRTNICRRVILN